MRRSARLCLASLALVSLAAPLARAAGTSPGPDAALDRLGTEYWEGQMQMNPTWATTLGDHRYDALLDDNTPEGVAKHRAFYAGMLARAKSLPAASLDAAHKLDQAALVQSLNERIDWIDCHYELWNVNPRGGAQVDFMNLPDVTTAWAVTSPGREHHAGWSEADSARFHADLEAAVRDGLNPPSSATARSCTTACCRPRARTTGPGWYRSRAGPRPTRR